MALDAAGAGDVNADHAAVQVHERAAAVGRLDDRVVLKDRREVTLVAQPAAHAVLVNAGSSAATALPTTARAAAAGVRVGPSPERDGLFHDGILAVDDDLNNFARFVLLDRGDHLDRRRDRFPVD